MSKTLGPGDQGNGLGYGPLLAQIPAWEPDDSLHFCLHLHERPGLAIGLTQD